MFDLREIHEQCHVTRYQIELTCVVQRHPQDLQVVPHSRTGEIPRLWSWLPLYGLLYPGADLHNCLDCALLEALHVWRAKFGEPHITDGWYQVQADGALVGNECGWCDIGLDGSEPSLEKLADRLLARRYDDPTLLIAERVRHFLGDFVSRGLGDNQPFRNLLAVGVQFPPSRDCGAPAAVGHFVDRTFGVAAFAFCHIIFPSLSIPARCLSCALSERARSQLLLFPRRAADGPLRVFGEVAARHLLPPLRVRTLGNSSSD